jgi:L-seryl-tRNA(Ser) seleniumtransferase
MKRRQIIKLLSVAPIAGGIIGSNIPFQSATASTAPLPLVKRNLFKELGLRTFINANCVCTDLTASLMPQEVLDAITSAASEFVMLDDVQDKVGEKIAAFCHAEAATVTAGCWSALVLGTAGVLTGMDNKRVNQLPFLEGTGMKSEVILQKGHADGYHRALTNAGVSLVFIETKEEAEAAINDKTAMMWFLNKGTSKGQIKHEEWLVLAKKHNIPTMIDIASDAYPVENLWKFNDMGFDLVALSGGKAMRGPQSAGILMGKKELIAAARLSAPPRGGICRGHKVNKEEILGMYVTIERYINLDHEKEWKIWEDRVAVIVNSLKSINGVSTEVFVPPYNSSSPTLNIFWDNKVKLNGDQLRAKLRNGNPSIEVKGRLRDGRINGIEVTVFMMKSGHAEEVARRIKEELQIFG